MIHIIKYTDYMYAKEKVNEILNKMDYSRDSLVFHELGNQHEIMNRINQIGFFVAKQVHIFYDASFLTSTKTYEQHQQLIDMLLSDNDYECILLVSGKTLKKDDIDKLFKKSNVIELEEINDLKKKKIFEDLIKNNNLSFDKKVIDNILEKVDNSYGNIVNEFNKLRIASQADLTNDEILELISDYSESSIFNLLQSFIEKKYDQAWNIYNDLLMRRNDEITIINVFSAELFNAYLVKLNEKSKSKINLMMSPYIINIYKKKFFIYNINEIIILINKINKLELDIKYSNIDKRIAFKKFLLNL